MASTASMRLPWRAIVRSSTNCPSPLLRHATLPIRQQTRHRPVRDQVRHSSSNGGSEEGYTPKLFDTVAVDSPDTAPTSEITTTSESNPTLEASTPVTTSKVFDTVTVESPTSTSEISTTSESNPTLEASTPEETTPAVTPKIVRSTADPRPESDRKPAKAVEQELTMRNNAASMLDALFPAEDLSSTVSEATPVVVAPPEDASPAVVHAADSPGAPPPVDAVSSPAADSQETASYSRVVKKRKEKRAPPPSLPANPFYPKQTGPQYKPLKAPEDPDEQRRITPESDVSDLYANHVRLPRAVQAVYLRPLKRKPKYSVPTCDLQIRSYSVRNLEFFCDFALRAAYYLGLPASGPVTLPRITERWTVPRGSFIHKKSQENFERRTVRRLIQIKDGNAESQELWLAFLRKHAYYGVGMKAHVWEFSKLGVGKQMDAQMEKMKEAVGSTLDNLAFSKLSKLKKSPLAALNEANFRQASGASGPMMDKRPKGTWPRGRPEQNIMPNQAEFLDPDVQRD